MSAYPADSTLSAYGRRLVEQARRLNISPGTFRRWMKVGLKATLVGGHWYVRDEDLDEFFAARTAARLGQPAPQTSPASKSHAEADAKLAAAGW
jgi:hypothetical protein